MQTIGIYLDGSQLKIAALSNEHLIERLEQSTHFCEKEWLGVLVSGIDGSKILIRHIESPLTKKRALEKTLPFQLENLIPFALNEVTVCPTYQMHKEKTKASFFVTPQITLEEHIIALGGADPAWVSCTPLALYRFSCFVKQDRNAYVIFHFGQQTTEVVSVVQGMIQHNISLGIGLQHLKAAYQRDCPNEQGPDRIHSMRRLDLHKLHSDDYPHLTELLQSFRREIDRCFCFLDHKQTTDKLKFLLFAGETETVFQLENWLKSWETFSYEILPITGHRGYDPKMVKMYAVPIGLALDAIKHDKKSVQFRQGEWIASDVYTKIKNKLIKGTYLCLISAAILFVFGHIICSKQEEKLLRQIDQFAKVYKKDIPGLEKVFSLQTSQDKIQFFNHHVKTMKSDYEYFSSPPLVADVLAFLSGHPKLNRHEGDKKMIIDHLHYELVQYPSIQEPYQSYKVKVDISFTSPESTWAREFHDAIVEDMDWVDQEEVITWAREQNAYTLSFILK